MTDTHIKINAVPPKVQYTGNGSTTVFPYEFPIFDDSDMVVYFDDEVQESGYTVSGAGQTEGGNVTFATPPDDGVKITLYRNIPIERITDFQEGGTFRPKNLNDEFDRQTAFLQQVQETLDRSVKVGVTSDVDPEAVLTEVERLYESIDNVDAVADDLTNIDAVAGDLTNIDAVAGDLTNIDAVAGDLANVDAVAADLSNIDAVAGNEANIDAVAGNESNINTVAGISSDVSSVAGAATDIGTVATNMSDVNDCATNMAAIQDAPTQAASAAASAEAAAQSVAVANPPPLLTHLWSDHLLNDVRYLRADTFSWQSGGVYVAAYNHLIADLNGLAETNSFKRYENENDETDYIWVLMGENDPHIDVGDYVYEITNDIATETYQITAKTTTTITVNNKTYKPGVGGGSIVDAGIIPEPQTETIGSYTVSYYQAEDGHKITTDEATVANIYNESGVAWYFVLDTANQRFKLPRENPAREELIQVVRAKGNGIALGLTCDGYNFGVVKSNQGNTTNAMESNTAVYGKSVGTYGGFNIGGYYAEHAMGITTDSTKSGIISDITDSASVYKGKKYLYFYVGNYTQSAIQQTAGLNAELFNGKVDLDAANLSDAGKSLVADLGMPGDTYEDLTLGASGATYTAPADGYFVLCKMTNSNNNQYMNIAVLKDGETTISDATQEYVVIGHVAGVNNGLAIMAPAKKGKVVSVGYNAGGETKFFRFIYAVGSESEAS